jgi:ABC-type bacteriocin/lantibiotic exporter with double-glycine peptidase domain
LSLEAGKKYALMGPAGSGKTTLLQLLSGLYDNFSGRISYNHIPLTALKHDKLRSQIGDNIWQESIFKGSLRENITLGKAGISDDDIWVALEIVGATAGVNDLPNGLDTPLSTGGFKIPRSLSKRLILSRSIVFSPKLMLLELDTDFLNAAETKMFYKYLFEMNGTVLAVCNDEEMLQNSDEIFVMEKGKIAFKGDYNELNMSDYAELIR